MYFSLEKDNKGISFMLFTGWMLPHVAAEFRGQKYFGEPVPCMVSSHDDKPGYEGQVPRMDCHIRGEGNPCYGDGSGLLATEAFDALVIGGEEGLWKFLEKKYVDWISHE